MRRRKKPQTDGCFYTIDKMVKIRIVVENAEQIPFVFEGERNHYIEIDIDDYNFDRLSQDARNMFYDWARKYHISVGAWDALEGILEDID